MAETAAAYIFKVVASSAIKAGASKAAAAFLAKSAVFAAKVGLTVGASAALNAAFAPRVSTPDSRIAQRQPTPERTAAFGRVRSAGAYTLYSTSGGDSIDVLAFHDGRIAGIDQIYLHDDLVSLGTGPLGAGFVLGDSRTDQYYEAIYIDTRLGTANQTAFTRARSKVPGEWSVQHCMDGVAALELLCLGPKKERLPKVYPLGLPRPSVVYRAQYCFDFRQSGQSIDDWRGWTPGSRNPVLQMVTYMCNPAVPDPAEPDRALGLGMDFDTEIAPHLDAWIAAANVCDQSVSKKGGGTEPRYQCDFEYFVGEEPADTLARFLAAFDGWMSETGDGALTVKAGAYDGSAVEIESDWVIGHAINRGVPDEQLKNVFVGFYTDPAKKFSQVEGAPWYDQGSIALTGKRRYERVPMTQVQSHGQLTRLLKRIALRRNAEARGTLRLSLPALDLLGERWLKFPTDFPNSEFLRGKIVEVESFEIDFSGGGAVIIDWAIYDTDADAFDPDAEEGAAPPAPSESELSTPPVIDVGDVSAQVDTESRFGGQRQAVAVLTFPAPVRSYDIAGAGSVDVPRTDLGWRVRWRIRPSGGWTESAISGDVIEGDEVSGWTVRLRTPDLPRAALDIQIASVGPRDDQGDWSDSLELDVDAASAPSLAAPANVTASATLEESEGGVKRPALTVSFDPITSPEAQMVLIAIKPAGDPETSFAQIDAIEPKLGGKTIYTIPYGRTVDVGLQTWAQWREPSVWAVVQGVAIPGEVVATDAVAPTADLNAAANIISEGRAALEDAASDMRASFAALADRGAQNDVTGALESFAEGVAVRTSRLEAPAENLITDAWANIGVELDWRDQTGAPATGAPKDGYKALQARADAAAAGEVLKLVYLPRRKVAAGEKYEINVKPTLSNATGAKVRLAIYAAESGGSETHAVEASLTSGARSGSFAAEVPASGYARFEVIAASAAGGEAVLEIEGPLWRKADAGQSVLSPAPTKDDPRLAVIKSTQAASARALENTLRLAIATENARVSASESFLLKADKGGTLAGYDLTLNAQFNSLQSSVDGKANAADVFSKAEANQRFLLQAGQGGTLAGYNLTLNAQFNSLQSSVAEKADAADVFSKADADQRFLLQAGQGGTLAGYNLTLNADFSALQTAVAGKANAADVFSKAEANNRFLLQADDGGSLAGYDLTLNAQFNSLSSSVAITAGAVADIEGSAAFVTLEASASGGSKAAISLVDGAGGSQVDIVTERLVIKDPSDNSLKDAIVIQGGVLKAPSVEVDTVKAAVIDAEQLIGGAATEQWLVSSTGNVTATATVANQTFLLLSTPYQNRGVAGVGGASFRTSGLLVRTGGTGNATVRFGVRTTAPGGGAPYGDWTFFKNYGLGEIHYLSIEHFAGLIGEWWEVGVLVTIANVGATYTLGGGFVGAVELRR